MGEMKESTKWAFWGIGIVIIIVLISWALMPVGKMVERKVLVESHQYKEGMADRVDTLEASLAEINARLNQNIDDQTRKSLEAQKSTITVQLNSVRKRRN